MSLYGIKEVSEAMIAANKLGLLAVTASQSGLDMGDALTVGKALLTDKDYIEGIRGAKDIMFEIKDLDPEEIGELIKLQTAYVFEFLKLFGKKP